VFDPRSLCVESVVDDVAMGQVFLLFVPLSFVPPLVHTHLSSQTVMLAIDSFVTGHIETTNETLDNSFLMT